MLGPRFFKWAGGGAGGGGESGNLRQNNRVQGGSFMIINMEVFIFPRKYLSKAL